MVICVGKFLGIRNSKESPEVVFFSLGKQPQLCGMYLPAGVD